MSVQKICIIGGTGFVGHSLTAQLARQGHQVTVVTRRRERHRDLLVLPTVQVVQGNARNVGVLCRHFAGVDAVINLVGILNESRSGGSFEEIHVRLPMRVLEACKQAGVRRLLHMSALHASTDAPSEYLRTKAKGEALVHQGAGPDLRVTSFRPSVIFGPRDSFINRFAALLKAVPGFFPLACPRARFQPVYVEDVARAFTLALGEFRTFGQGYDLCGPRIYTLEELVAYVARELGLRRRIIGLPDSLSRLQAALLGLLPGKPFSLDNYRSLKVDSVCERRRTPETRSPYRGALQEVFGITPTPLESVVPSYLVYPQRSRRYSFYRRFARRG